MKDHIALHEKALALLDLLVRAMKRLEDYKEAVNRWDNASDWDTIRLVNTRLTLSNRVDTYVRVVARIRSAYIAQSQKIWLQVYQGFPVEKTFTAWGELEALEKKQVPASTRECNEYPLAELTHMKRCMSPSPLNYSAYNNCGTKLPDDIPFCFEGINLPVFHDHIHGEAASPWSTNIHSSFKTQSNDNNLPAD